MPQKEKNTLKESINQMRVFLIVLGIALGAGFSFKGVTYLMEQYGMICALLYLPWVFILIYLFNKYVDKIIR